MVVGKSLYLNCWLFKITRPSFHLSMCPCIQVFHYCLWFTSIIWVVLPSRIMAWITHPHTCISCIHGAVDTHWAHLLMMMGKVVLGEIISQISSVRFPKYVIMALVNSILDPIKMYINFFGTFLMHLVADGTTSSWIASMHECVRLGVTQFFKGRTGWFTGFGFAE